MKLFLVRHGDTVHIQQGLMQGWIGSELTDEGREQAEIVGNKLKNKKIDLIMASDLSRTKQTAEIISNIINAPIIFDWLIRERDNGIFNGKPRERMNWDELNIENEANKSKGLEPISNVVKRVTAFVENLNYLPVRHDNILVISHNGLLNNLLIQLGERQAFQQIRHDEIVEIELETE
jgi:probable phosphoglycerate mutase